MAWEHRYFSSQELACRCGCGAGERIEDIDMELLNRLCTVREQFGPMSVTSGARCPLHNKNEGGKPGSAHVTIPGERPCRAVDIRCTDSVQRGKLLGLVYAHFKRVGVARSFIHMDVAGGPEYASPSTWLYS